MLTLILPRTLVRALCFYQTPQKASQLHFSRCTNFTSLAQPQHLQYKLLFLARHGHFSNPSFSHTHTHAHSDTHTSSYTLSIKGYLGWSTTARHFAYFHIHTYACNMSSTVYVSKIIIRRKLCRNAVGQVSVTCVDSRGACVLRLHCSNCLL